MNGDFLCNSGKIDAHSTKIVAIPESVVKDRTRPGPPSRVAGHQAPFSCQYVQTRSFWQSPWFAPQIPVVFVISAVSMISTDSALNPRICGCLSCFRRSRRFREVPVVFVKATRLQTIGLVNHSFRNDCSLVGVLSVGRCLSARRSQAHMLVEPVRL